MVSALDQLDQEMKNGIDELVTSEVEEMGKEQRPYQKIKKHQKNWQRQNMTMHQKGINSIRNKICNRYLRENPSS